MNNDKMRRENDEMRKKTDETFVKLRKAKWERS